MLKANGLPKAVIVNQADAIRASKISDYKRKTTVVFPESDELVLRMRSKRVTTRRFTWVQVYEDDSPNASDNEDKPDHAEVQAAEF